MLCRGGSCYLRGARGGKVASTSATSVHDILCLAHNLCKNLSSSNSYSILQGLVMCFHARPIVLMGIVAVHIRNLIFLWVWAMLPLMIYIVST